MEAMFNFHSATVADEENETPILPIEPPEPPQNSPEPIPIGEWLSDQQSTSSPQSQNIVPDATDEASATACASTTQPGPSSINTTTTSPAEPTPAHILSPQKHFRPEEYSPTRAEIESHPLRQRLIERKEEVRVGVGSFATPEEELSTWSFAPIEVQDEKMGDTNDIEKGDNVSYQWGGGQPGGTVSKVSEDKVEMETKRGNTVTKKGEEGNPALYIERSEGHDVVKKASEVGVTKKGSGGGGKKGGASGGGGEKKESDDTKKKSGDDKKEESGANADAKTGEKRAADDDAEKDEEDGKKQKTAEEKPKANGDSAAPKKKGRPAKKAEESGAGGEKAKKETKKKAPKKAATESGEPRRSGRNAGK